MDINKCEGFYRIVKFLASIKKLHDSGDTEIINDIADCELDEEFRVKAYHSFALFISMTMSLANG